MSHTTTTQPTPQSPKGDLPQWAIDAASEIESWHIATSRPDSSYVAAIIARHAPAECRYTDPTAEIESRDARIAVLEQREKELEAENARLRELVCRMSEWIAHGTTLPHEWNLELASVINRQ